MNPHSDWTIQCWLQPLSKMVHNTNYATQHYLSQPSNAWCTTPPLDPRQTHLPPPSACPTTRNWLPPVSSVPCSNRSFNGWWLMWTTFTGKSLPLHLCLTKMKTKDFQYCSLTTKTATPWLKRSPPSRISSLPLLAMGEWRWVALFGMYINRMCHTVLRSTLGPYAFVPTTAITPLYTHHNLARTSGHMQWYAIPQYTQWCTPTL